MLNLYLFKSHIFTDLKTVSQRNNYILMEISFVTLFYFL